MKGNVLSLTSFGKNGAIKLCGIKLTMFDIARQARMTFCFGLDPQILPVDGEVLPPELSALSREALSNCPMAIFTNPE